MDSNLSLVSKPHETDRVSTPSLAHRTGEYVYVHLREQELLLQLTVSGQFLMCEARMRKQFREEDQNKTGKITTKSLKEQLQNKKAKINMDDVEKWIKENDKDKDGKVDFEEFFKFARHKL
ncbi:uncharacterized protein DEA37_0010276 [Paragonimus westermani]|uniref:EF-hand domain-containing protein n=1 Tax=Paragonimus westermani TaxID=34504 RepID=A0A5J4NGC3_9TREM|nr:uncharacterized protein DEA37_0010276 [Paragonimus westermani]